MEINVKCLWEKLKSNEKLLNDSNNYAQETKKCNNNTK